MGRRKEEAGGHWLWRKFLDRGGTWKQMPNQRIGSRGREQASTMLLLVVWIWLQSPDYPWNMLWILKCFQNSKLNKTGILKVHSVALTTKPQWTISEPTVVNYRRIRVWPKGLRKRGDEIDLPRFWIARFQLNDFYPYFLAVNIGYCDNLKVR